MSKLYTKKHNIMPHSDDSDAKMRKKPAVLAVWKALQRKSKFVKTQETLFIKNHVSCFIKISY